MHKIVLASSNPGKIREIRSILAPREISVQSEFGVPVVEESGLTFVENAILKARHAAHYTGHPAIADDSGIEVDALGGAPGVFSARYAGAGAGDAENLRKLLDATRDVPDAERSARYRCVMVYLRNARDPGPLIAEGVWEGRLLRAAVGTGGFGYDPIFFVPETNCSSAQLPAGVKNRLSHRGRALKALARMLAAL